MQAFSDVRRNGVNPRDIVRYGFILLALVVYESLGTIYYLLPPLFGFWFAFVAHKKDQRYMWLAMCYILFYEADHGLIVASGCLFLYFFLKFVVPTIEDIIVSRFAIAAVSIASAYLVYYALVSLIYFLFGMEPLSFSWLLVYYIFVELIIAAAVLR
ncbi:MAG: hypothetical protein LBF86_07670 [Helicobacteraceae bacterium]|nr:hypothetical protein [Helicobacteraceae bacterium]